MYFNKPIFENKINNDTVAMEKVNKIDLAEKEYTIRNKYYPLVASFLSKTERLLFRHISQYRDKNISILSSPYPLSYPLWNASVDETILYKCINIDKNELRKDILNVKLPEGVTQKRNFKPFQTALLLAMRYYIMTKQEDKLKVLYSYYAYSIYWSIYNRQLRHFLPSEEHMIYTINNLSNKFKIKQFSSTDELLFYVIETTITKYRDRIENMSDSDIWYVIDQAKTRLGNYFKKIVDEYFKNFRNKDLIFKSDEFYDEDGTHRIDSSVSSSVEVLSNAYTTEFFASPPDTSRVNMAAKLAGVSSAELKSTLLTIARDNQVADMKRFYESLFHIYLTSDDPKATVDSIRSTKFLSVMRNIFKKGNSTDKNIVATRELMNKWLERGSNTYRATPRQATKNDYRLAVYYYFILSVTSNK